jgi:hypothetical protein
MTTLVTPEQPSLSRGQVPKSNEHTKIIDAVLELKIERVTQDWGLRERSLELKRVCQSIYMLN